MRALVIGGTGFVGNTVVAAFDNIGIDTVALSRTGETFVGSAIRGDVRAHDLALSSADAEELRGSVTHVVSCFGSVDWHSSPRVATELHQGGTCNVMRFAETCPRLERFVHLSSILVLGRTTRRVIAELELGQSFRNWYEYGKYLAEREVRSNERIPWRAVRLGPVLGPGRHVRPTVQHGILAAVPLLLRGYPIHLTRHGRFPSYPCDVATAGHVIARAALDPGEHQVWTWFDEANPSLASVLVELCSPWNVMPRIIDVPLFGSLGRATIERLGAPRELLEYVDPWAEIGPEVLDVLPSDLPRCPEAYLRATGQAIRNADAVSLA
jgi:nucleoside-diphosphate-sugar epimerase